MVLCADLHGKARQILCHAMQLILHTSDHQIYSYNITSSGFATQPHDAIEYFRYTKTARIVAVKNVKKEWVVIGIDIQLHKSCSHPLICNPLVEHLGSDFCVEHGRQVGYILEWFVACSHEVTMFQKASHQCGDSQRP